MECELKLISRDIKEAIEFLPTWGGIGYFTKILLAEAIVIVPIFVLAGINTVIGIIIAFVIVCFALVYYNASTECKELEVN